MSIIIRILRFKTGQASARYIFGALFACLALAWTGSSEARLVQATVNSPDSNIVVSFKLAAGAPQYSVAVNGQALIEPSGLGFIFNRNESLVANRRHRRAQGETDTR